MPQNIELRDWFAGHALATMVINSDWPFEDMAKTAYDMADAFLAERDRSKEK